MTHLSLSVHDTSLDDPGTSCRLSNEWQMATPRVHRHLLGCPVRMYDPDV